MTKEEGLRALATRRMRYKNKRKIDNSALVAGQPMFFDCIVCNADIVLPEGYFPPRRKLCPECQDLKELGWLE